RKVVFLDEMPWMDTFRSNFLTAFEGFWNGWAVFRTDILLIVCGSATTWILKKVVHSREGLHNRLSVRIRLEPFTLHECRQYAEEEGLSFDERQIAECYMALGGVAYYWSLLEKGMSAEQNINRLFFSKDEGLHDEFEELYASLFRNPQPYERIIQALGKRRYGLTRGEILANVGKASGGDMTKYLEELEECGFIRSYHVAGAMKRGRLYQLTDNFSLFHLQFSLSRGMDVDNYWTAYVSEGAKYAWRGFAFERLCLSHVRQIKEKLGISGVAVDVYAWRQGGTENGDAGVQIDLLLDRKDGIINLCEMKYSDGEYVLDQAELERMIKRRETFRRACNVKKSIHLTLITSNGLRHNNYSGNIQSELTLADLFRA
ncbi:MAG: ATP-binding protein, partial [Kiritimatiellae bacterium]|nr:ATP-binding protein [Kiritimatiellia bacterium]